MKIVFVCLLFIVGTLAVGGCAFMDAEDRDFYGKGWVKPTDLDKEPMHHKIVDPSHPETTNAPAARTASAPTPEPEWLTPVPTTR